MHFLFDADVMLHKVSYDAETLNQGVVYFENLYRGWLNYLKGYFGNMSDVTLFLTSNDRSNFRYELPSEFRYKYNRQGKTKPPIFFELKEYVHSKGAIMAFGREADDLIAIEATKLGNKCVIVSNDKDYRQVAGCWHWETTQEQAPYFVTDPGFLFKKRYKDNKIKIFGTGVKFFYFQILAGDQGDGVPGLKGIGNGKAFDLLDQCTNEKDMWTVVANEYEKRGSTEDRAIENARLLWLQRTPEEPLWEPPVYLFKD
jgi:5'-3' exonuclease